MSWTHLGDTNPVARKEYRCCLCDYMIAQGERHVARRGVNDDGMVTARMHARCESLTHDWDDWDWEAGTTEEFREMLKERAASAARDGA